MALLALFAGFGMFCALLWYCAIYALPVFVGFSAGWWALNHGAGLACVVVGLIAGIATWLVGNLAATSGNSLLRVVGLAAFVIPAAYAGFGIVRDLVGYATLPWRDLLAVFGAVGTGSVTAVRLMAWKE